MRTGGPKSHRGYFKEISCIPSNSLEFLSKEEKTLKKKKKLPLMDKTYMFVSFKGKFHSEFNHQIHTKIKKKIDF